MSEKFEFKTKKEKNWLLGLLRSEVVDITFTKKDGTERVMNCTLLEDYLPETTGAGRSAGSDALAVFDVDADGWRSFRWDSVKAVKLSVESADA